MRKRVNKWEAPKGCIAVREKVGCKGCQFDDLWCTAPWRSQCCSCYRHDGVSVIFKKIIWWREILKGAILRIAIGLLAVWLLEKFVY